MKPHLTPDVLAAFAAYHAANPVWGALHLVLEDGNVGDRTVQWCIDHALEVGDAEGRRLAVLLLRMSRSQRTRLPQKVAKMAVST